MTANALDFDLLWVGAFAQFALTALLAWRRIFRRLPIFFAFQIWCVLTTLADIPAVNLPRVAYIWCFLVGMTADQLFELAILFELSRNLLRCNRQAPLTRTLFLSLFALAASIIFSVNEWTVAPNADALYRACVHLRQVFAILSVASLLALVLWSSLKELRWPATELRVACGLGFYFTVNLAVAIFHTHVSDGLLYHWLDNVAMASYLGTISYWVLKFSKKDTRSLNFSPQM